MRQLLRICDEFDQKFSVMFNSAKSVWLLVSKSKQPFKCVPELYIGNQCTDLASEYVHLGHIVSAGLDDKNEILSKQNSLCGKINNVLCCFWKRDPLVKLKLLRSYCSDFYGSVLWDMT